MCFYANLLNLIFDHTTVIKERGAETRYFFAIAHQEISNFLRVIEQAGVDKKRHLAKTL